MALEENYADIGQTCVEFIKESSHLVKDPGFFLETEFLQAELMVKNLKDKQVKFYLFFILLLT